MGEGTEAQERVRCLVMLRAIHRTPPSAGDTRGALLFTDNMYPGEFLASVGYFSVGGMPYWGMKLMMLQRQRVTRFTPRGGKVLLIGLPSLPTRVFVGIGTVSGDGVVPLECVRLHWAHQITLEGIIHSINKAGTTAPTDMWYGLDGVIDQ